MLITSSRALDGRLRDSLVGRDLLVGILCGAGSRLVESIGSWSHAWLSLERPEFTERDAFTRLNTLPLSGVSDHWPLILTLENIKNRSL